MFKSYRNMKEEILMKLESGQMCIGEVADAIRVSRTTAEKYLAILEAEGKIKSEFIGVGKYYRVKE